MSPDTTHAELRNTRQAEWAAAIDAELQYLLGEMSTLVKEKNTAQTTTKRKYYEKKIGKIKPQVMQMLAAQAHLNKDKPVEAEADVNAQA